MKTKTANSFIFAIMIVFIAIVSMPQNGYAEDKKVSTAYADGTEQHRIKGVTVEIPSIWEETKKSDTEYYFYDRQDVFWRSNFLYINILPLPEQTDTITDEIAAEILEGIKSGMTDCTVHSVTPYPSEAYSGYLYKLSGNVAFTDVNVTALIAIIDDELYQFVFTENAKTKYDYSEDVEQIFKSISPRLHYEDEYIEFDYQDIGISITRTGTTYIFSDPKASAIYETGSALAVSILDLSEEKVEELLVNYKKYGDVEELVSGSFRVNTDDFAFNLKIYQFDEDSYVELIYELAEESTDAVNNALVDIINSMKFKKLISEMEANSNDGLNDEELDICKRYYAEDWEISNVELALDVCYKYRSAQISKEEAKEKLDEIADLLYDGGNFSTYWLVNTTHTSLILDAKGFAENIKEMENFLENVIR